MSLPHILSPPHYPHPRGDESCEIMIFHERLKYAREFLGMTQKEVAARCSVSVQMWQAYESGKSVPGGKVLEGLARLGINVNWLLTGEASVALANIFQPSSQDGGSMADKFKIIRGNLTYYEFAKRFVKQEKDIKEWGDFFKDVEEGKIQPDWLYISAICHEFGISPSWMLEDEGPMFKKDIEIKFDNDKILIAGRSLSKKSIDLAYLIDMYAGSQLVNEIENKLLKVKEIVESQNIGT